MSNQVQDNAYRFDTRTEEEFKRDIQAGIAIENDIITRFSQRYEKRTGKKLNITANGCDQSGEFLNQNQVTTQADYLVDGRPVEVKFNRSHNRILNLKVSQVRSYIRQGADILLVKGYNSNNPQYAWLTVKDLTEIVHTKEIVENPWMGNKKCYELLASDYIWHTL